MIKAIVFDFDGLILDTETSEYETVRVEGRRARPVADPGRPERQVELVAVLTVELLPGREGRHLGVEDQPVEVEHQRAHAGQWISLPPVMLIAWPVM